MKNKDFQCIRELEYVASIYIQYDELDKAAEIMALAEHLGRDRFREQQTQRDNLAWLKAQSQHYRKHA